MALGGFVLGSLLLYLKGMRTTMFQLSGFYCSRPLQGFCRLYGKSHEGLGFGTSFVFWGPDLRIRGLGLKGLRTREEFEGFKL